MKTIKIRVSPSGDEVIIQPSGYAGNDCVAATKGLEQALGKIASDKKASESYQQEKERVVQ